MKGDLPWRIYETYLTFEGANRADLERRLEGNILQCI